jgi:hypothetical protein
MSEPLEGDMPRVACLSGRCCSNSCTSAAAAAAGMAYVVCMRQFPHMCSCTLACSSVLQHPGSSTGQHSGLQMALHLQAIG